MDTRLLTGAATVLLLAALTGCTPSSPAGTASDSPTPGSSDGGTSSPSTSPEPTASATPTMKPVALPTDCRAILSEDVLSQLGDTPLNDAAFGPSGVGTEGTLTCIWADPAADTTNLVTTISRMSRGPALDMLNALVTDEDFQCFTPSGGTRCEKTWPNEEYPVTDGRTLFWRDDVMIDTRYSNLAPTGYTDSIIAALFD